MASKQKPGVLTRRSTEVWIIGQLSATLPSSKLPSTREVMSLFFNYKKTLKQTNREASNSAAVDVIDVWDRSRIPTKWKADVVSKIETEFREWENLGRSKNKAKTSEVLKRKEIQWIEKLDELFDIAHADAMNIIKNQEDREFLLAQREKGRRGKIGNVDRVLAMKEAKSEMKQENYLKRRKREEEEKINRSLKVQMESSSSESEKSTDSAKEYKANEPSTSSEARPKRGRKSVMDVKLAASLDVAKLSDRNAAMVLIPTLQHLGHDPFEFNVNATSIRRQRMKFRKQLAEGIKEQFKAEVPITIHWDGKMLQDISGKEIVDRLPILISGKGVDQLLGVPKLSTGTGDSIATEVFNICNDWDLSAKIKCMSFDTTSTNTGAKNGACINLEKKMEKDLLWLACRHHIMEIMLEAVVTLAIGPSTGPELLLFKRFQKSWSTINTSRYDTAASDDIVFSSTKAISAEMVAFAESQLKEYQPRDDYRELLELTIIFLGSVPAKGVTFKAPGGLHRARWMAKAIYALKIWLFRSQFKLSKKEEKGIRDISIFTVRIYVKVWFQAPSPVYAPRNDLQLLKDLCAYREINTAIANIALQKFRGHLWYLSEELVAFAFFDDRVSVETKLKMVKALDNKADEEPVKRITLDPAVIEAKELEHFLTSNTKRFFSVTGLNCTFFQKEVTEWENDDQYKATRNAVQCMRVVNDIAERGVALMEEYNKLHTNDEEQKQFLLLVVKDFRAKYPDRKKTTLIKTDP